jgi:hypothetical protein
VGRPGEPHTLYRRKQDQQRSRQRRRPRPPGGAARARPDRARCQRGLKFAAAGADRLDKRSGRAFCLSPRERAYGGRSRRTRRPRPLLSSLSVDLARRRARQKQWSGRRPKSESERAIFAESPAGLAGVRIQPSGRRAIVVERSIGSLELVNLLRKRERPVDPRFVDLPINHCSQDA